MLNFYWKMLMITKNLRYQLWIMKELETSWMESQILRYGTIIPPLFAELALIGLQSIQPITIFIDLHIFIDF